MIALDELLGLLPSNLLSRLEVRYKLDAGNQVKLTGSTLFVCLLNNVLNHPLVTQRLLQATFWRHTGKSVNHSGIGRALSRVSPEYFGAVFEHLYGRLAPQAGRGESAALRLRFVDATIVSLSTKLMRFGLVGGIGVRKKERIGLVKAVFSVTDEGWPSLLRLCKEPSEHDDSRALGPSMVETTQPGLLSVFDRGMKSRDHLLALHERGGFFLTPKSTQKVTTSRILLSQNPPQPLEELPAPLPTEEPFRLIRVSLGLFENSQKEPRFKQMPLLVMELIRFDQRSRKWTPLTLLTNLPIQEEAPETPMAGPYTFTEVAQLYRRRWEIELFFRFLKEHLGYEHLASRSENGIRIMTYMALIAALLLIWYRRKAHVTTGWRTVKYWLAENARLWTEDVLSRNLSPPSLATEFT